MTDELNEQFNPQPPKKKRGIIFKLFKWIGIIVAVLIALFIGLLVYVEYQGKNRDYFALECDWLKKDNGDDNQAYFMIRKSYDRKYPQGIYNSPIKGDTVNRDTKITDLNLLERHAHSDKKYHYFKSYSGELGLRLNRKTLGITIGRYDATNTPKFTDLSANDGQEGKYRFACEQITNEAFYDFIRPKFEEHIGSLKL